MQVDISPVVEDIEANAVLFCLKDILVNVVVLFS